MDDLYIKPGNQERGWNDPPQFSYGLQTARGPHRNLLNKRAAPGVGAPPLTPPSSNPLSPLSGATPPPLHPARPPLGCVATPPPPLGPMRSQKGREQADSSQPGGGAQVCSDVEKRLRLLEDSWRSGRLSLPVRRRMDTLSLALQSGQWDSADDIHRSLMVDHVTEVSQWMVAVKRLIAETRKLNPELLEPLQRPAGPDQVPAGPNQVPADPDQVPAGPDQVPADPEPVPAGPDQDPADPDQVPADPEPVQDC
ncbi:steroid receptor RNA activator 1 [Perca fluviatilis]|uniref:steroid receptor RNA activator 1 n=1 Tax=Perca fluviatilis TaxID=8168 RepID=UPI001965CB1E|nr:steroid receptor RNA activator 1 [Perca fluviatilis]